MSKEIKKAGHPQTARELLLQPLIVPLFPTANKYLQQKWDQAAYDMHRKRVNAAKPVVNSGPPKIHSHVTPKKKNHKAEAARVLEIQRENNRLTEKISYIMRTPGRVNNRNFYKKESLGNKKQQMEMLSIAKENQKIQFKLSQVKPVYSVKRWHEDWLNTLELMERICRYPHDRANQQKGQEEHSEVSRKCGVKQKKSKDTTTSRPLHASNKKNGKVDAEGNAKKKNKQQGRGYGNTDTFKPNALPDKKKKKGTKERNHQIHQRIQVLNQ